MILSGRRIAALCGRKVHAKSHVRFIYISPGISTTLSLTASVGGSTILYFCYGHITVHDNWSF